MNRSKIAEIGRIRVFLLKLGVFREEKRGIEAELGKIEAENPKCAEFGEEKWEWRGDETE